MGTDPKSRSFEYFRFTGKHTRSGPVPRSAVLSAIGMCIANAKVLLEAAESIKSTPRVGLAVVALEELSKIDLFLLTATIAPEDTDQWRQFWKSFTSHHPKLQTAVSVYMTDMVPDVHGLPGFVPEEFAKCLNLIKQASWYVDYVDGEFLGPPHTFEPAVADIVLSIASKQARDAIQQMEIYELIYDDLAKFAKGARTAEDLWNAQIKIAQARSQPVPARAAALIAHAPYEQRMKKIFDFD